MRFLQSVYAEGSKVTWPSRRETALTTVMVMIMTIMAATFFFLVDQVLSWGVQLVLSSV